jgi:uncharacterized membrane protein YhiD involved in acid resistance
MNTASSNSSGGIGFAGALTCIFAAAKVFGFSNMSWLWVFSPIWIAAGIVVAILVIGFLIISGIELYESRQIRKRRKQRELRGAYVPRSRKRSRFNRG